MNLLLSKSFKYAAVITILLVTITCISCKENNDNTPAKGSIQFVFGTTSVKSGRTQSTPATAMIVSIKDSNGNVVYDKKSLTIFSFGDQYISDPLELKTGNFTLTEFFIVDANNNTLYATPLEGSNLAYLVNDPAPISFSVSKDNTTKVSPEVIAVTNNNAGDFGYVTFSLNEVPTFAFSIAVFIYDNTSQNFQLTTAHVNVTSSTTSLYGMDVQNITNSILVRDGFTTYHVEVVKDGYTSFEQDFAVADIKAFTASAALTVKLFPASLSSGLVAWYPFTGNAQDASGNAVNGTVAGATLTTDKNNTANSAYYFNGSTYINIPSASLKLNVYSYSVWVNITTLPTYGNATNAFSIGDDVTTRHQAVGVEYGYGTALATGLSVGGWNNGATLTSTVSTNALPNANQWYHIVMTRSADAVTMYVNNQLIGSAVTNGYLPFYGSSTTANIGARCNYTQNFVGKIDDMRIYNRVLTTTEIANLFNQ